MPKQKAIIIVGLILLSLLPMYGLYKYLQQKMKPKESLSRFFSWLLIMFLAIFGYTFLLVLLIKLIFPGA